MASLKWFERIKAAQAADRERPPGPLPRFDFASLGTRNPVARWFTRFARLRRLLPLVAAVLRGFWLNPRFGRVIVVTRRADAEAVLSDMKRFCVVYEPEMAELGAGTNNILGEDGERHDALHATISGALSRQDVENVPLGCARTRRR